MPKFPNIPRLTIVVPHVGKAEAFESSLVSVLQHRPDDCEVFVPHAGDYDDPFDLGDEVQFIDAESPRWMNLISAAAQQAHGRFIHVVGGGHVVTANWTEAATAEFESSQCGCVVPVVRYADETEIAYAGWRRSLASACDLVAAGKEDVTARQCRNVEGGFLTASFWRRDLLRSVTNAYRGNDIIEASVVTGLLAAQAGWRSVVSRDCTINAPESGESDYDLQIVENHRRLQAISDHITGNGGWGKAFGRMTTTVFQTGLGSAIARATAPLAAAAVDKLIDPSGVLRVDQQAETFRIPASDQQPLSRAA
ncbi:glycosyltransferase family 2 protein [Neorhodopirellula lusitana]|uniref:glycosyltransferase family 2 protein n=1 Tax=Neorhodopirellula lusitana TaxID=445327 RepID=UPI00384C1F3A